MYEKIFNPVKQDPGSQWFYHEKSGISIAYIPKNGTTTLSATLKDGWILRNEPSINALAIIRHPLSRWISGFATHLSLRIDHGHTTYKELKQIIQSRKGINYIMGIISFDIHTKAQHLFLEGVEHVRLFSADERSPFYQYLASHGLEIEELDIHNHKKFPKDSHNTKLISDIKKMIYIDLSRMKWICEYYKKDIKLYESCTNN